MIKTLLLSLALLLPPGLNAQNFDALNLYGLVNGSSQGRQSGSVSYGYSLTSLPFAAVVAPPQTEAMEILYGVAGRAKTDHLLVRLHLEEARLNDLLDYINLPGNKPSYQQWLRNQYSNNQLVNTEWVLNHRFQPIGQSAPLQLTFFLEFRYPRLANMSTTAFSILADYIPNGQHSKSFTITE